MNFIYDGDSVLNRRDGSEADVFSFRTTKDGKVFISWYGKHVITLQGKAAKKFIMKINGVENSEAQRVMATVTGNFKRGNEKRRRKDE